MLRLASAYTKRFSVTVILVSIFSFALALFFIPPLLQRLQIHETRIGMVGRFRVDTLPPSIWKRITSGLTTMNDEGYPQPDIAASWEVQEGGKTWVFHITPGKLWQDGTTLTSHSLGYSFDGVTIERPDDHTIVFHLSSPFAAMPSLVSRPVYKRGLLGTGEWQVNTLTLSGEYIENMSLTNRNTKEKVTYHFYPSEDRAKLAYKLGEVDILEALSDPAPFSSWSTSLVTSTVMEKRFAAVFFNTEHEASILESKELRQGLSYALDKDALDSRRAISPLFESSWAYNSQVKRYDYDEARAKQLLGKKIETPLVFVTIPSLLPTAERIAQAWKAIGVPVNVTVSSTRPETFDAFLVYYDAPYDPDQYLLWHSTQKETNISHFSNPRIDNLLEEGRLEMNQDARKKIYLDFQRFLLEEAPAIFLYHPLTYTVSRQ